MTPLNQIIQDSLDNGWDMFGWKDHVEYKDWDCYFSSTDYESQDCFEILLQTPGSKIDWKQDFSLSDLIFNHNFMKALYGEELIHYDMNPYKHCGGIVSNPDEGISKCFKCGEEGLLNEELVDEAYLVHGYKLYEIESDTDRLNYLLQSRGA